MYFKCAMKKQQLMKIKIKYQEKRMPKEDVGEEITRKALKVGKN